MKDLTEIEDYVTHTYKSLLWIKDPVYNGIALTHPARAALTNTAAILAMPTTTTPEIVLVGLEDEVKKVNAWVSTPQEYIEKILARYEEIMDFISEGAYTVNKKGKTARALAWLQEQAPRGKKIFSHVTTYTNAPCLVDCYVIIPDTQGEYDSIWLNRQMGQIGAPINAQEQLIQSGTPEEVAQNMAEYLGFAVWDDRKAYSFKRL